MKRMKHHCCYRLERGRRAGQMCREALDGRLYTRSNGEPDTSEYCIRHSLMVLDRWAKELLSNKVTQ